MNWKKLVAELSAAGLTQKQIADAAGCSQSCIAGLSSGKRGVRVSYEIGVPLVRLHKRFCRSGRG